jgi:ABC-type molybdenum transport system ATPase subunit/photorepair protein PhrA
MTLQSIRTFKSIKMGSVDGVELPAFTVLTGQNGSGKSNLLEAIREGHVIFSELGNLPGEQMRLFKLGELLSAIEGPVQAISYKEPWANLYNNVKNWRLQALNNPSFMNNESAQVNFASDQAIAARLITRLALDRMMRETEKSLSEMTEADFKSYAPLLGGIRDPFAASIAEIFLSYEQRRSANERAQWIQKEKGRGTSLTDEEFIARFGGAPWVLLDEILKLVGLPYRFVAPPEDTDNLIYEVALVDEEDNSILPSYLSSGERVLLAVALSLFSGSRISEAIELPRVLLLDEADASLHPMMVKSLLTVIEEIFVKQYSVRVILTTHSPSTVALAPAESLFVMSRTSPKLRPATPDEALSLLTVGLSSLSVRLENRRQVFVESEVDQAIYQDLFRVLKGRINSDRSAEFVSVGKRSVGGGCDAVIRLVSELRAAGNATIAGIVDRDHRTETPSHVHYLPDRHSIENLLLDPLLIGAFLLREGIVSSSDLGLPEEIRHFELGQEHATRIVHALATKLKFNGTPIDVEYLGGFSASVPSDFFEMQGHALKVHLVTTFSGLQRYQDKDLMQAIVNKAVSDLPAFVPRSLVNLLEEVLVG